MLCNSQHSQFAVFSSIPQYSAGYTGNAFFSMCIVFTVVSYRVTSVMLTFHPVGPDDLGVSATFTSYVHSSTRTMSVPTSLSGMALRRSHRSATGSNQSGGGSRKGVTTGLQLLHRVGSCAVPLFIPDNLRYGSCELVGLLTGNRPINVDSLLSQP